MSCQSGKVGYRSKRRALRAAETTRQRVGIAIKCAYRCPDCDEWHLTSKPRRRKPKATRKPNRLQLVPPVVEIELRAKPCRCDRPIVDMNGGGECIRCGHLPEALLAA